MTNYYNQKHKERLRERYQNLSEEEKGRRILKFN